MTVAIGAAVVAVPGPRRRFDVRSPLLRYWPLVAVLSLGAIVRLWTELAYSALLTPDSWKGRGLVPLRQGGLADELRGIPSA